MRKLFISLTIMLLGIGCGLAWAQSSNKYSRKQLKPDFFIPDGELDYGDKLSHRKKFDIDNSEHKAQMLQIINEANNEEESLGAYEEEGEIPLEGEIYYAKANKYLQYSQQDFNNMPEYKQKYNDYMRDLAFIAETGQAPTNYTLKKDLDKMSSNKKILVNENFGIRK